MAHFAELSNNVVVRVVLVSNDVTIPVSPAPEIEQLGINFLKALYGQETNWKQTSYNTHKGQHDHAKPQNRKNFAGIGDKYDNARKAFISPSPYPSWILDKDTCVYESPAPYPQDGKKYKWDEDTESWILAV